MIRHLATDGFLLVGVLAVLYVAGPTAMTVAMVVLAVAHLITVAAVVWVFGHVNRHVTARSDAATAGFWAAANTIRRLRGGQAERVAAAYRSADTDGTVASACARAHVAAIYSRAVSRTGRDRVSREIDWCERELPGSSALLYAMLTHAEVAPGDFAILTAPAVAMGLPVFCPTPACEVPAVVRVGSRVASRLRYA